MSQATGSVQSNLITCPDGKKRRRLRLNTVDEAIAEAQHLAAADRAGRLTQLGNWPLGQALGHLATWAEFPFKGYPESVHAPWFVRMILRLMRNQILAKGMMPGVKIRNIPSGTLGLDLLTPDEGLRRYRAAMERLKSSCPTVINPVFGKLTHEQWIQLNLRHAELHLSFQLPSE